MLSIFALFILIYSFTDVELTDTLLDRITELTRMPPEDREHAYAMLDAFVTSAKLKTALR